jgi:hypothetical protein
VGDLGRIENWFSSTVVIGVGGRYFEKWEHMEVKGTEPCLKK